MFAKAKSGEEENNEDEEEENSGKLDKFNKLQNQKSVGIIKDLSAKNKVLPTVVKPAKFIPIGS